jgi:hypothetical protein
MTRLTIDLPAPIQLRLQARAAQAGYASVEEHVAALIRAELDAADDSRGRPSI